LVTVDHGLQDGSAERALRVADLGYELGFDPVQVIAVEVGAAGGPEAAARTARYAALSAARSALASHVWERFGAMSDEKLPDSASGMDGSAGLVLLGHTADDQAETVLLGLGRGSGPRSIAGMRPSRNGYLRPLLGIRRADTAAACAALGLPVWADPHNVDARFRRVRLRTEVLPLLEEALAGGVVEALARTAQQLQDDLDALDDIAADVLSEALIPPDQLEVASVARQPAAIKTRVLKGWAEQNGARGLTALHVAELSGLITDWRGQGPIDLPGAYRAVRSSGRLKLIRLDTSGSPGSARPHSPPQE
jgi:tRNA(Ile)-lysidine synthase